VPMVSQLTLFFKECTLTMLDFLFRNRRKVETVLRVLAFMFTVVFEAILSVYNYANDQFSPAQ
jgi:hypothetical protein